MKLKASALLISTFLVMCLSGAIPNAQAWFDEDPQFQVSPRVLVGYMLPTQNNTLNVYMPNLSWTENNGTNRTAKSSINGFLQSAKMEGVWLELILPAKTSYPVGFTTSFGYLVPAKYRAQEYYLGGGGQVASRTWGQDTTLYNIKLSVDFPVTESLTGMLGFLYDSLTTSFSDPENIVQTGSYRKFAQAGSLGVSVGIPFVGLQYERPFLSRFDLKASAIGFPALLGSVSYQESVQYQINVTSPPNISAAITVNFNGAQQISFGYFYEAFAQLSTPVWRGFSAGAFVKFSEYSAKLDHLDVTNGVTDPVMKGDISFTRKPFIIGANITASF